MNLSESDILDAIGKASNARHVCRGPECTREPKARGLCGGHYQQVRRGRPLTAIRAYGVSSVCQKCGTAEYAKGLCNRCYQQARRTGTLPNSGTNVPRTGR